MAARVPWQSILINIGIAALSQFLTQIPEIVKEPKPTKPKTPKPLKVKTLKSSARNSG